MGIHFGSVLFLITFEALPDTVMAPACKLVNEIIMIILVLIQSFLLKKLKYFRSLPCYPL